MRQRSDSRVLPVFTDEDGDRRGSSSVASAANDTASKTGFRAMVNFQGRLFFFFVLTWVVFILYIIWVSQRHTTIFEYLLLILFA